MTARGSWHAAAREMAATHTRRQTAEALGVLYGTLKAWAGREGVGFLPERAPDVAAPVEDDETPPAGMDDDARCALLATLLAAERQATERRARDRKLRALTARSEPARDVVAALAKLEAA